MALEATTRLWRDVARTELLGTAVKVTDQQYPPRVRGREGRRRRAARPRARRCSPRRRIVDQDQGARHRRRAAPDRQPRARRASSTTPSWSPRSPTSSRHVQNGHILYATALHYLTHSAAFFVRWVVQPAIMTLQAWSRRAEVTCDRAALLAVRDLDKTLQALVKLELGVDKGAAFNADEYLRAVPDAEEGHRPLRRAVPLASLRPQARPGAPAVRRLGAVRAGDRPGSRRQADRLPTSTSRSPT